MKNSIYETIIGEREGYVVNIDYDKFLHWNHKDSSFIILGRGELSIRIQGDILKISSDNYDDEFDLIDLDESLSIDESLFSVIGKSKFIIIKTELIVDQIDLEGVIYTSNVYTAEKLLSDFCDRIDFNVELVVPLNNLRLLNDMIKHHHNVIKFVKHIRINGQSVLVIVTQYNTEKVLKSIIQDIKNNKEDYYNDDKIISDEQAINNFMKHCEAEMNCGIFEADTVEKLMEEYAKFSDNPYENIARKHFNEMESDEAYMDLYNKELRRIKRY